MRGEVPMPPQAALNDADADKIISAIIGLSKGISEKTGTLQGKIKLSSDVSSEPGGAWELTDKLEGYSLAIIHIPAR
jgi:cytochrome c